MPSSVRAVLEEIARQDSDNGAQARWPCRRTSSSVRLVDGCRCWQRDGSAAINIISHTVSSIVAEGYKVLVVTVHFTDRQFSGTLGDPGGLVHVVCSDRHLDDVPVLVVKPFTSFDHVTDTVTLHIVSVHRALQRRPVLPRPLRGPWTFQLISDVHACPSVSSAESVFLQPLI